MESSIEGSTHTEGCVGELRRLFEEYLTDCNSNRLLNYPKLLTDNELKEVFTSNEIDEGMLVLVPGAALFLADKSTEMRGVLNDLQAMGVAGDQLSCPFWRHWVRIRRGSFKSRLRGMKVMSRLA